MSSVADWHVPTLREVFALLSHCPPRLFFLDSKLPPGEPEVARRLATQYIDALREYPDLRDRALVACPDAALLAVMKAAFAAAPDFTNFDGFALDHEELSDFALGHSIDAAAPLRGSQGNRYLSIGAPYKPLSIGDFDDLLTLVARTLAETRRPGSPHYGKPLCVWTIDEEPQLRALAALGPEYILTDQPALLQRVLDERYAPADPRRPGVMCHRGGPDGCGAPENTLPLLARGVASGDAVEFDVCSAVDGAVLHHDNDPRGLIAVYRRSGGGVGEFRPTCAIPPASRRRLDQQTTVEIQAAYGYARDEKGPLADAETVVQAAAEEVRQFIKGR